MPNITKVQNSFSAGEFDPRLRGRIDTEAYYNAAQKLRNVFVSSQGAVKRRYGLEFKAKTEETENILVLPFYRLHNDTYTVVVYDDPNTIFVYKDGVLKSGATDHPFPPAIIPKLTWAQSNEILIFFSRLTQPYYIRIVEGGLVTNKGYWELRNIPTYNFESTPPSGDITITASDDSNIDFKVWYYGDNLIKAGVIQTECKATRTEDWETADIGRHIRSYLGGYAVITEVAGSVATITILAPFNNDENDGSTKYKESEWFLEDLSWSESKGWPACGVFFQGRLWMASTFFQANTAWASKVNDEYDFGNWNPNYDDDGIQVSSAGTTKSYFNRMIVGQHLFLFSDAGEYYIPISKDQPLKPSNVSIIKNSSFGNDPDIQPVLAANSLIFVKNDDKAIIELEYNFAKGSYISNNLSLLSPHLLNDIKSLTYKESSSGDESDYICVTNGDGSFAVLCFLKNQDVIAWTLSHTDGAVKDCVAEDDHIYLFIKRSYQTEMVIEELNPNALLDWSLIKHFDVPTDTITGAEIERFDGVEVQIIVDNTVLEPQIISGDSVTFEKAGYDIQIGLNFPYVENYPYRVLVETLPIEFEGDWGSSIGKKKRVSEVIVMLYETSHVEINKNNIPIRRFDINNLDDPIPRVSENLKISGLLGWDDEVVIQVGQILPLPFQLLGLGYKVKV